MRGSPVFCFLILLLSAVSFAVADAWRWDADLARSSDGWWFSRSSSGAPAFRGYASDEHGGGLVLSVRTSPEGTFGSWNGPLLHPPEDDGTGPWLYHLRFHVSSHVTTPTAVPGMRVRAQTRDLQVTPEYYVDSNSDGRFQPTLKARPYDLLFELHGAEPAFTPIFDLHDSDPTTAPGGDLQLQRVEVTRYRLSELPQADDVQSWTFAEHEDGWTSFSLRQEIAPAVFGHDPKQGALTLSAPEGAYEAFGGWGTYGAVAPEADSIIAMRLLIESNSPAAQRALQPVFRLRFNEGDFRAASTLHIASEGTASVMPYSGAPRWFTLWHRSSGLTTGLPPIVNIDMIASSPRDIPQTMYYLREVRLERRPLWF